MNNLNIYEYRVPNLEQTVKIDYEKIKGEMNNSIDRWLKLPISVMGRVNVLKMTMLPKLLYSMYSKIFLCLPLLICLNGLKKERS